MSATPPDENPRTTSVSNSVKLLNHSIELPSKIHHNGTTEAEEVDQLAAEVTKMLPKNNTASKKSSFISNPERENTVGSHRFSSSQNSYQFLPSNQ